MQKLYTTTKTLDRWVHTGCFEYNDAGGIWGGSNQPDKCMTVKKVTVLKCEVEHFVIQMMFEIDETVQSLRDI